VNKEEIYGYVTKLNVKLAPFNVEYVPMSNSMYLSFMLGRTNSVPEDAGKKEIMVVLLGLIESVITDSINTLGHEGEDLRQKIMEVLEK